MNYHVLCFRNTVSVPTKSSKDDATEGQFAPGDNVEVIEGELINLQGKIVSVEGNKIVMLPFHDDLKVRFEYSRFTSGDHKNLHGSLWTMGKQRGLANKQSCVGQ